MLDINSSVDKYIKIEQGSLSTIPDIGEISASEQKGLLENVVANFSYTEEAFNSNDCQGVDTFDFTQQQNIPKNSPEALNMNLSVLNTGFQTNSSSVSRDAQNHFWGRVSYNLNKLNILFSNLLKNYKDDLAQNANFYSPTAGYLEGNVVLFGVEGRIVTFRRNSKGSQPSVGIAPSLKITADSLWEVVTEGVEYIDTGDTLTFTSGGSVELTNTATTRTISNGLWLGQKATLFNATASTITVTDGEFTFTVLANNKREIQWNGTKWESKANLDTLTVLTKATVPTPIDTTDATNKGYVDGRTGFYITETGGDNNQWYRKWSDGFIEQGGIASTNTVTFIVPFLNLPTIVIGLNDATSSETVSLNGISVKNRSLNGFTTVTGGIWFSRPWLASGF